MAVKHLYISIEKLRADGALRIETLDNKGNTAAITKFSVLKIGADSREVIEIRTETKHGNTEQRVEVQS
jgi:hypothetical protein